MKFKCVLPLFPMKNTELPLRFIQGVVYSMGYEATKEDYLKGIILLEFERT